MSKAEVNRDKNPMERNQSAIELIRLKIEGRSIEDEVREWRKHKAKIANLLEQADKIAVKRNELNTIIKDKLRKIESHSVMVDNVVTKYKSRESKYVSYKTMFVYAFSKVNGQTKKVIEEFQKTITNTKEHESLKDEIFGLSFDWLVDAGRRVIDSIVRIWSDFFRSRNLDEWYRSITELDMVI